MAHPHEAEPLASRSLSPQAVAEDLQSQHPAWLVVWGEWSLRYWACPWLLAPSGLWLSSPDPVELVRWMAEYERRYGWAPGGSRP